MKDRCFNEKAVNFKHYGEKGISVHSAWVCNFESFKEWAITSGYSDGLSIDRVDHNGDYSPDNCRWVSKSENTQEMLNRRYLNGTGQFSDDSIEKLTETNRDGLGAKFEMILDGSVVSVYRCLIECAEYIVDLRGLKTEPVQIKKNISACLNGKRNKCHGFTFKRIGELK